MSDRQTGVQNGNRKGLTDLLTKSGPLADFWEHFNRFRPDIEKAIGPLQTHTVDDIWLGIVNGQFQLWQRDNSVVITELVVYPRCKSLRIFLAAGKMDEVLDIEEHLCKYAAYHGCKFIEHGGGRKGWEKIGLRKGYTKQCSLMVKRLDNG